MVTSLEKQLITRSWEFFFIMGILILRILGLIVKSIGPVNYVVKMIENNL